MDWDGNRAHSLSLASLYQSLDTSDSGLSQQEVARRLEKYGKNSPSDVKRKPWYDLLFAQFTNLPIIMLICAALVSLALGLFVDREKLLDAAAITVALLLACLFGFFQEYKAENAIAALKKMAISRSVVVRSGKDYEIDSSEIVLGDIVELEEGNRVPADIRLIESANLAVDASMLTGESKPSKKEAGTLPAKTQMPDRSNMIFAGTLVVRGRCKGVVVATGGLTEFGKIARFVAETAESETPLQKSIHELSKTLGIVGLAFATLFFVFGTAMGETAVNMLVVAITLAVAVIPEGLPTVLAITMALGVQKMARKNAIVRKMAAVEALGSATVICTDKTGTLTQNKMAVHRIMLPHRTYSLENGTLEESMVRRDPVLCRALEISVLCNNAMEVESNGQKSMSGDPTEIALLQSVSSCYSEFGKLRHKNKSIAEIPFDSARKMMSAIRFYGKGRMAFVKGAPERLLPKCSKCLSEKGESQLDAAERSEFLNKARGMGAEGMRVLALAYRPVKKQNSYSPQNTERDLVFVGFVGMDDPPRKEVASAIALCKTAGIRVMMVTGDSLPTAKAIAARVGLLEHGQIAIEGSEIEEMDDSELERILPNVCIFARTTPEQKYRITSALMRMGEVVAVTGDGVNDAPALKKANIGVAMGLSGNDVSKGVADIVLTDDNFTSIVHAVRYGRAIFSNIKAFVRYQISTNVAALSLMFTAPMLSFPLPLLPLQLLWINIIVDGPPALALGVEPPSHDEMDQPPRNPKTPLLSRNFSAAIIFTGLLMAALSLAVFAHYCAVAPEKAGTAVFTLFVFMQLANALNCRFARRSAFARLFANPWLLLALVASVAIQLVIIFNPSLQPVFRTVPLSEWDFGLILVATSILLIVEEARKKFLPSTTVY